MWWAKVETVESLEHSALPTSILLAEDKAGYACIYVLSVLIIKKKKEYT